MGGYANGSSVLPVTGFDMAWPLFVLLVVLVLVGVVKALEARAR